MTSAEREPTEEMSPDELASSLEREPERAESDSDDGQFDSQDMPATDGEFVDAGDSDPE